MKKSRKRLVLYTKLSTIVGLTWVSGFIATATKFEVLWYIFIVLNASQGIFIFVSFALSKKVLRLLKERKQLTSSMALSSSSRHQNKTVSTKL